MGTTRRGPMSIRPRPLNRTSLSPPRPTETTRTASIMGFNVPILTPSVPISGIRL
jgi:hypothetical protein